MVRAHLVDHFARAGIASEPEVASVTFLGVEPIDVLRFGPDVRPGLKGVYHHVSLGCSRHPMAEPTDLMADPHQGPRAEVMVSLRGPTPTGLSGALIDMEAPLWTSSPFTAMLLAPSDVEAATLPPPDDPVMLLAATPITPTEAAWVRLKGAGAMREAWRTDGVDVLDPRRPAAQPK